jgi:ferrous iron transport protein B
MEYEIILAGNPNVGKSTVFNSLTGLKQHTGNWSGKTVELASGSGVHNGAKYKVTDLPGTYSLMARSREEEIARDYIGACGENAVVVIICDASCLERNLNLVLQILEITPRAVVCVNFMDEAVRKGINIDAERLSELLGAPVVLTTARRRKGLQGLLDAVEAERLRESAKPRRIITVDAPDDDAQVRLFVQTAERISAQCVSHEKDIIHNRKIDRFLTNKITGIPVMILFFVMIFWITIAGANYPTDFLTAMFSRLREVLHELCAFMPAWLSGLLVDGVYSVLSWVVAVMLPPMAIFFPLFTLLEDLGYLPRIAFNLDRFFKKANACGKQALTMGIEFNMLWLNSCECAL